MWASTNISSSTFQSTHMEQRKRGRKNPPFINRAKKGPRTKGPQNLFAIKMTESPCVRRCLLKQDSLPDGDQYDKEILLRIKSIIEACSKQVEVAACMQPCWLLVFT